MLRIFSSFVNVFLEVKLMIFVLDFIIFEVEFKVGFKVEFELETVGFGLIIGEFMIGGLIGGSLSGELLEFESRLDSGTGGLEIRGESEPVNSELEPEIGVFAPAETEPEPEPEPAPVSESETGREPAGEFPRLRSLMPFLNLLRAALKVNLSRA